MELNIGMCNVNISMYVYVQLHVYLAVYTIDFLIMAQCFVIRTKNCIIKKLERIQLNLYLFVSNKCYFLERI